MLTSSQKDFDKDLIPQTWMYPKKHFFAALDTNWYKLTFKLKAEFYFASCDFFRNQGYLPAMMPITCDSVTSPMGLGSDSIPVQINLFNETTYLADSMQFHLEYLLRQGYPGVFYIMSTFRGENPDERHLNQFFHSESEILGHLEDVMRLVGKYVAYCSERILEKYRSDLLRFVDNLDHVEQVINTKGVFPQVSYEEATNILGCDKKYYSKVSKDDYVISQEGEKALIDKFNGIVWLTHFPAKITPFYQAYTDDKKHSKCADLLLGIGEVAGCGERHLGHEETLEAIVKHNIKPTLYEWYILMKEIYPVQTSGFGLGIERFLLWFTKHDDIRNIPLIHRIKGLKSIP
jgi:asparaginyl-tRNA synthetase